MGPCPYPDDVPCPPVVVIEPGLPDLYALELRQERREAEIIAEGEAMLAARWDLGVDTRSLVKHDITRPRTPEELALEADAIADGEARSRARDDDA